MGFPAPGIRRRDLLAALLMGAAGLGRQSAFAEPDFPPDRALDRDIGGMIVIGFNGDSPDSPGARAVADWLRAGLVGGVIFFEDNLRNPDAVKALTKSF